jgi:N-methylhydantoinase A/oxoprolinase/acetone carboxylase beta subunit
LTGLIDGLRYGSLALRRVESLEARRLVLRAGFTPTDALHVLGRFERWDAEASGLGAALLAAQAGLAPDALCERVSSGVSDRVTRALVSKVLGDEATVPDGSTELAEVWERESSAEALLARALGNVPASELDCRLTLRSPLVAVGAPVEAYLPRVSRQLSTELIVPPHAEVANAVGAVAGSVVLKLSATIRPMDGIERFRLHLPDGVRDFGTVEEGVAHARQVVPERLQALARQAGAEHVEMRVSRVDRSAPVRAEWGEQIYLETRLTFTAVGRPGPVRS